MEVLFLIIGIVLLIYLRKIFEEKGFKGGFWLFFVLSAIGLFIRSYKTIFNSAFSYNTFLTILGLLLLALLVSLVLTTCWFIAYKVTRTTLFFIIFGGIIASLLLYVFSLILEKVSVLIPTKAIILYFLN